MKKGQHPVTVETRLIVARLIQLHQETHPERIARAFGFSAWYVRKLWQETRLAEMPHVVAALMELERRKSGQAQSCDEKQAAEV